jgi:hypothetical protein
MVVATDNKVPEPGPLSEEDCANFETLRRAHRSGDLALVSAIRKADGKQVALVCAMGRDEKGNYCPVPLAVMVEGNPYELFHDPTSTGDDDGESHSREEGPQGQSRGGHQEG